LFCGAIFNEGTLTIDSSTLSGNATVEIGGGIFNNGTATVNGSTLSGNSASEGGGIWNSGFLAVGNSDFSGIGPDDIFGSYFDLGGNIPPAATQGLRMPCAKTSAFTEQSERGLGQVYRTTGRTGQNPRLVSSFREGSL
jgi:hypothetical protein